MSFKRKDSFQAMDIKTWILMFVKSKLNRKRRKIDETKEYPLIYFYMMFRYYLICQYVSPNHEIPIMLTGIDRYIDLVKIHR